MWLCDIKLNLDYVITYCVNNVKATIFYHRHDTRISVVNKDHNYDKFSKTII